MSSTFEHLMTGFGVALTPINLMLAAVGGFIVASALMTVPVARVFGGSWRQSVIAGVALGVSFFLLFDRVFDVILPAGLLSVLG